MSVVDKLTAIDVKAATSAGEIATGLSQFASLAGLNGINIDQASAMVATIADVTQMSGSSVGQALKTIISRYGAVKSGAYSNLDTDYDSEETAGALNDVEKVLAKVGVAVRDSNLQFRELDDVLEDLAEKWITLDNVSQNAIASAFAGTRQRNSFITLMSNMDKYHELLEESENSAGTAQKKYEAYQESIEAWTKKLQAAWESLANDANIQDFIKTILKVSTGLVKTLPIILKYVTRFATISNAFKVGPLLKTLGGFVGVQKQDNQRWFGKGGAIGEIIGTKEGYLRRADRYKKEQGGAFIVKSLQQAIDKSSAAADKMQGAAETQNQAAETQNQAAQTQEQSAEAQNQAAQTQEQAAVQNQTGMNVSPGAQGGHALARIGKNMGARIAAGAMGAISGAATATQESQGNIFGLTGATAGKKYEMSKGVGIASRVVTGATTFIASLWGPLAGMIAGFASDAIMQYFVGPLVDNVKNTAHDLAESGSNLLNSSNKLAESINNLSDTLKKDIWTQEDIDEIHKYVQEILKEAYGTSDEAVDLRKNLELYLNKILGNNKTLDELYDEYSSSTKKLQEFSTALEVANSRVKTYATYLSQTEDRYNLSKEKQKIQKTLLDEFDSADFLSSAYKDVFDKIDNQYKQRYIKQNNIDESIISNPNWWESVRTDYLRDIIQDVKKELGVSADTLTELIESSDQASVLLRDTLKELKENTSQIRQLNKEIDETGISSAILSAKFNDKRISQMSAQELKTLGADKIIDIIAKELSSSDYKSTIYKNGKITEYTYSEILKMVKQDDALKKIFSGQIYTLNEALKLVTSDEYGTDYRVNKGIQENFMNIFGVHNIEDLQEKAKVFGELTLGQLSQNSTELENSMSEISSLVDQISSGSKSWAETQKTIIEKYPELIAYMSDAVMLQTKLIEKVLTFAQLEVKTKFEEIMSSTETFNAIFKEFENIEKYKDLYTQIKPLVDEKNVKNFNDLAKLLANIEDGLSEEVTAAITELTGGMDIISDIQKQLRKNVIEAETKILDKEINNLEEQKNALKSINSQREYENKLIEAKLKLENSYQEKKRVWREGVGWVYESDQTAISEAEKNVKNLEAEKEGSVLEAHISELKAIKQQLSNITEDEKWNEAIETIKSWYNAYTDSTDGVIPGVQSILTALTDPESGLNHYVKSFAESFDNYKKEQEAARAEYRKPDTGKLAEAWSKLEEAEKEMNTKTRSDGSQKTKAEQQADIRNYNTALDNYKTVYGEAAEAGYINNDDYTASSGYFSQEAQLTGTGSGGKKEAADLDSSTYYFIKNSEKKATDHGLKADAGYIVKKGNKSIDYQDFKAIYNNPINKGKVVGWDLNGNPKTIDFTDFNSFTQSNGIYYLYGTNSKRGFYIVENGQIYGSEFNEIGTDLDNRYKLGPHTELDADWDDIYGHWVNKKWEETKLYPHKMGTFSSEAGMSLINELGTEAIITPQGTLTALPSKTGIVPADVTKNLWELGELAPSFVKLIEHYPEYMSGNANASVTDESFNITNFTMNVDADDSFDVDEFVRSVKERVSLTKNKK